MENALKKEGIESPKAWLRGIEGDLDRALAETVTLAVDDVLLEDLLDRLKDVPLAEDLLIGASVYQVPVDEVGLAWQVGEEVEAPEDPAAPGQLPLQVSDEFGPAIEALFTLGLLAPVDSEEGHCFVHRWTATAVLGRASADRVRDSHSRAARYWRWRVEKVPQSKQQDIEDLLQARFHHREAEEIDAAVEVTVTEWVCSQLDTWGAYRREEQLCREVLGWVPEGSPAAANFSHQLGIVAQDRGDYEQALDWYKKSLLILEELGNRPGMASSYHHLGMVAQDRGDYDQALDWYKKSLLIEEELGDRAGMASSYHQLGMVAQDRGDYDQALDWYKKSLLIKEELGNRAGMASSYHQLGNVSYLRGDYEQALDWYKKSLLINEELGNRAGMATSYHQFGIVAQNRGDYDQALDWYKKSLLINEELGNRAGMAISWGQMAVLLTEKGQPEAGVPLALRCLAAFSEMGSPNLKLALQLLNRQRELLGESRFGEILREHLDEEGGRAVLELMERFSKAREKSPPSGGKE